METIEPAIAAGCASGMDSGESRKVSDPVRPALLVRLAGSRLRMVRRPAKGAGVEGHSNLSARSPQLLDSRRIDAISRRKLMGTAAQPPTSARLPLERVAGGCGRAMEECIHEHGGLVWSIVSRRVSDRSAAEDLVQEIFTEVWKSAGRFDPGRSSESTFVAMIARRRAIDWLRKQQRLPEFEPLPESGEIGEAAAAPARGEALDREAVWQALEALPRETRDLFSLHFEQGLSHNEIAERTGMPLGSVKTRLRRGLVAARAILRRLGDPGMAAAGVSSA